MKLQTHIPLKQQSKNLIDYKSNILLLGSCFAENMGDKFQYFKFQITVNPFGIIFNPVSLANIVERSLNKNYFSENDIFFHNESWHCFEVHSELSNPNKEVFLNALNALIDSTYQQLKESTHIIITLGTSWIYKHIGTNQIVANCHKVPQKEFKKELLSIEDITTALKSIVNAIGSINNKAEIIFTISPVRHLKDGFIENTQSKAHLIAAIHAKNYQPKTNNQQPTTNNYFPSYEILMDELRDYRFYAEDMVHPNQLAINYIWECFKTVWISDQASNIMNDVDSIQKDLQHKPFNAVSEAYQVFLQKLEQKKATVQAQFPHIKF